MTRNDHSNQLELSIRPRPGVDLGQWDWGIIISIKIKLHSLGMSKDFLLITMWYKKILEKAILCFVDDRPSVNLNVLNVWPELGMDNSIFS